jgi:hypothetical protein
MTLVQTTVQTAYNIIQKGNRKIKATKGEGSFFVEWININNQTFMMKTQKNSSLMGNCEDYNFYIVVPNKAKKVY